MLRHTFWIGLSGLSLLAAGCSDDKETIDEPQEEEIRVDPLLFGVVTIPAPLPLKVFTVSIGFATPTNILHHDYDARVGELGCNADHLDSSATPPDIYPGPADGGIVKITGYSGGTLFDGSTAPSEIHCKYNAMPPSYRCGYGPLDAEGNLGTSINSLPFPIDSSPVVEGDIITFESAGGGQFGAFPMPGAAPTSAVVPGELTATLGGVMLDPTKDTIIEVECPGGCSGLAGTRITAVRKTEPKTTSGLIQCLSPISPTNARVVIEKEAIRTMRGCDADGKNCDTSLEDVQVAIFRFNPPNDSVDSRGNRIVNIAAAQGVAVTMPLKP